jgi:hypothetical protein
MGIVAGLTEENRMKNEDKIMGTILVFVFCLIVVIIIMQQREIPEVRHAMESSYGEEPKPEGHGL